MFYEDFSLRTVYGNGTWKLVSPDTIVARLNMIDHVIKFNLSTLEGAIIEPIQDPKSRIRPKVLQPLQTLPPFVKEFI